MAGLMKPGQGSAPRNEKPVAPSGLTAERESEGGSENVSPEEQQQYETFVTNGMSIIYGDGSMPQVLQAIEADGNPVEGLANVLTMIVMRLEDSAKQSGTELTADVMFHGARELLEQLVDLAEQAGIAQIDEKQMDSAFYLALDMYRSQRQEQGALNTDELKAGMNEIMQAEQQGQLDELLPGLSEFAKNAPQPPPDAIRPQDQQRRGLLV